MYWFLPALDSNPTRNLCANPLPRGPRRPLNTSTIKHVLDTKERTPPRRPTGRTPPPDGGRPYSHNQPIGAGKVCGYATAQGLASAARPTGPEWPKATPPAPYLNWSSLVPLSEKTPMLLRCSLKASEPGLRRRGIAAVRTTEMPKAMAMGTHTGASTAPVAGTPL